MPLTRNSNTNARWEVIWQGKRGLVKKPFEHDFSEALKAYTLLVGAGKKSVTLRCCNVPFPPPVSITEHEVTSWEVVKRRGKRYKRAVITYRNLMIGLNNRGVMWCPFCIKLRRYRTEKINRRVVMSCPVCGVTSLHFHVRQYNPKATILEQRIVRARRTRTRVRRRS